MLVPDQPHARQSQSATCSTGKWRQKFYPRYFISDLIYLKEGIRAQ